MRKKIFSISLLAILSPFFVFASSIEGSLNTGIYTGPQGYLMQNPVASPVAGTYTSTKSVSLSATGSNTIRYTLDGSSPACPSTGTLYSGAITVSSTKTLKAIACYGLDNAASTAVMTYTYTINISSGGSTGGGGGGGYYPTPTATPTPTPTPTAMPIVGPITIPTLPANPTQADYQNLLNALLQQLAYLQGLLASQGGGATPTPTISPSGAGYKFTVGLAYGDSGEGVRQLQIFLKAQGPEIYPEGLITGYFGSLTQKAVQRFQEKYGIAKAGDPGYGYVGPMTRAKINALQGL